MASAVKNFVYGISDPPLLAWWKELQEMASWELSQLTPFIRITPLLVLGSDIKAHKTTVLLDLYQSQTADKETYKGKYALTSADVEVYGEAGTKFKVTLDIDIFDHRALDPASNSGLDYLTGLGNMIKFEFG
jgi:hypothetical protein